MHLDKAHLFASCVQIIHGFLNTAGNRTHGDQHAVGIGGAVVVEQVVFPSRNGADLLHIILNHIRKSGVVVVAGFSYLEVDVRILYRGVDHGMLGV